jgi:hypothetical protein
MGRRRFLAAAVNHNHHKKEAAMVESDRLCARIDDLDRAVFHSNTARFEALLEPFAQINFQLSAETCHRSLWRTLRHHKRPQFCHP